MNLIRKPVGKLNEKQMVYWLERMRVVYRHMGKLISDPKESPEVIQTARKAQENALETGRLITEQLKALNPLNPVLNDTTIPRELPILEQWERLKALDE